jgi:hypothetical protein
MKTKVLSFLLKFWCAWIGVFAIYLAFSQEEIRVDWKFLGQGEITYYTPGGKSSTRELYQSGGNPTPGQYITVRLNPFQPLQKLFSLSSFEYFIRINGKGNLKMSIIRNGKLCSEVSKEIDGDERVEITCITSKVFL